MVVDDDYGKCGIVDWSDGRFAYSFAGLATAETLKFDAGSWLGKTLCRAGAPAGDCLAGMARFGELASQRFRALRLPAVDKRISISFVGFRRNPVSGEAEPRVCVVTNFEDEDGEGRPEAAAQFDVRWEVLPPNSGVARFFGSGVQARLELSTFERLLGDPNVPPEEVVKASVRVIRQAAADPRTGGTVGRNCSSLILGRKSDFVVGAYHPDHTAIDYYVPDYVNATYSPESGAYFVQGLTARAEDEKGSPTGVMATDYVNKNASCPCRSGLKYKRCHGSAKPPPIRAMKIGSNFLAARFAETDDSGEMISVHGRPNGGGIDFIKVGPIFAVRGSGRVLSPVRA